MTGARTIDVRAALAADADAMCDAQVDGWRVAYRGLFPDAYLDSDAFDATRRAWWRGATWLDDEATITFAGLVDGLVRGFVVAGPERVDGVESGSDRGEVYSFYLHSASWGSGLASALMQRAETWLSERSFRECTLWVLRDNPRARQFYEKAGWQWSGRESLWAGPSMPDVAASAPVAEVQYVRVLTA